jgi:ABC-type multidrug transport system ATPase subunit
MLQIQLNGCGKNYQKQWLFRNLSANLNIEFGDSLAILGKNGSGKSTLTLLLTGQISPTEGSINWIINGKKIDEFQWHNHYSLSSPSLELPEELTLIEWFQFQSKIKPFYDFVDLDYLLSTCNFSTKTANKAIGNYSSGMKQRVKLCLSILTNTPLSIIDEPFSNLDSEGIDLYYTLIEKFQQQKFFVIASNRSEEYTFAKSRIQIENGEISFQN